MTLLALGNGAPDIFGAYAAITQAKGGDAGLAIGAIFGKATTSDTIANMYIISLRGRDICDYNSCGCYRLLLQLYPHQEAIPA